jgi:hypothetical protein
MCDFPFNIVVKLLQDPPGVQPCIVARGCKDGNPLQSSELIVFMDGLEVVTSDSSVDLSVAFSCLVAVYFVYSVQYADKIKNTLIFFENFIYGLSTDKVPTTVQRLYNMLH